MPHVLVAHSPLESFQSFPSPVLLEPFEVEHLLLVVPQQIEGQVVAEGDVDVLVRLGEQVQLLVVELDDLEFLCDVVLRRK